MQRIRDLILEIRIWWAMQEALSHTEFSASRAAWKRHARLIAQRSTGQVQRMEKRMGLAGK